MFKYAKYSVLHVFFALLVCCGCSQQSGVRGNFAKVESVELVQDAMSALLSSYPPAKTKIALLQEVDDAFGSSLVKAMRANGYAVVEYSGPVRGDKYYSAIKKPDGLPFSYVLDHLDNGDQLRVSLHIGDGTLSCIYSVHRRGQETIYSPRGFWTRRQ